MTDKTKLFPEGRMLKEIRLRRGLTQADVAIEIGITDSAICYWEKGNPPHSTNMRRLRAWISANQHVLEDDWLLQAEAAAVSAHEVQQGSLDVLSPLEQQWHIIDRKKEAPIRFQGRELGNTQVGAGRLILYRTIGGNAVWEYDGDGGSGTDIECFKQLQSHPVMQRNASAVRQLMTDCGLIFYEDVP